MYDKKNGYIKTMRGAATIENNMEVPQETKKELSYDPATPFLGIYPEKNYNSKRCMHPYVHGSTIYSIQGMETT